MAKRIFTILLCVLALISFTQLNSQVTFAFKPASITTSPAVGSNVTLDVVVRNFTDVVSFQYSIDWDGALLQYVSHSTGASFPDRSEIIANAVGGNGFILGWNSIGGVGRTAANETVLCSITFRVLATSTNYWAKFGTAYSTMEVVKFPSIDVTNTTIFGNLGNPPGSSSTPLTITTSSHTIQTNGNVCVSVTTKDFTNLNNANLKFKWDSTVLRYTSLANLNTTLGLSQAVHFNTNNAIGNGRLQFNWTDQGTSVKSLPDNSKLFDICFNGIGSGGKSTTVRTLPDSSSALKIDGGNTQLAVAGINGTVSITSPPGSLTFSAANTSGKLNDTICVKIYAKNFTNIASMQWSMHWDSTKFELYRLRFNNATLGVPDSFPSAGGAQFFGNPSSGTATFLWSASDGFGKTFTSPPDSTEFMQVCLKIIGGSGTSTAFRFDGTPLRARVFNGDVVIVPHTFNNGTLTVTVPSDPAITASSSVTNVKCKSGSDGAISLTVSGGTGTYTYSWTGPSSFTATTKDISNLKAGEYKVTITSGTSTNNLTINVTEPAAALTATKNVTDVNCFSASTGSVTLTPAGGTAPYTYAWSSGETTKDITGKAAGSYTVTITDANNCKLNESATIAQPASAVVVGTPITTTTGCGQSTGTVTINPTGGTPGYTYSWSGPGGFSATTKDLTARPSGNYAVTVTDSKGCTATATASVNETTGAVVTPQATNIACKNGTTGAITLTVTGGTGAITYSWTGPNNFTSTSKDISSLAAGTYNVTATDANNCKTTSSTTLTEPSAISAGTPSVTNAGCGTSNGSISINPTGGTAPYTYSWTGPNGFTATSKDISGLGAGTYNVTVTDAGTCTATATATVTASGSSIVIGTPSVTNVLCAGALTGGISISPTGGAAPYTYTWSNNATTKDLVNVAAGNYQVTVKDANNCSTTSSTITIQSATAINVDGTTENANVTCNGKINLNVTGGQSPYVFTPSNLTNLCPGNYTITVTDANNCTATKAFTIGGTVAPQIRTTDSVVLDAGCPGQNKGSITFNFVGGTPNFTFEWLNEAGAVISRQQNQTTRTAVLTNLQAGSYRLRIIDANSLTHTSSLVPVTESTTNVNIEVTGLNNETCEGNNGSINLTITSGAKPFKFRWNDIAGDGPEDRTGLKEGSYSVTVMDGKGCEADKSNITVRKELCRLESATTKRDVKCNGGATGSITVEIFNGEFPYIVKWSNTDSARVSTKSGTYEIKNLKAGDYTITITDNRGQQLTRATSVTEPKALTAKTSVKNDDGCCNGTISLTVSEGVLPYTYRWNDGNTSRDREGLCGGAIRAVEITDGNGCILSLKNDTIQRQFVAIDVQAKITDTDCGTNTSTGKIELTVKGGAICSAGYEYSWSFNGFKGKDLVNVPAGKYTVTISDAATPKQTVTKEFEVKTSSTLIAEATVVDKTVTIRITGGLPSYKITTTNNAINTITSNNTLVINTLPAGPYEGTVTDSKGCAAVIKWTIKGCSVVPQSLFGSFNLKCTDSDDGTARVTTIDPDLTSPYNFRWSNGEAGQTAIRLKAGSHTVTVLGANGKSCTETVVMTAPERLTVNVIADSKDCALTADTKGGTFPIKYEWFTKTNDTTRVIKPGRGNFTVKVTDKNGCTMLGSNELNCGEFCLEGANVLTPNDDGLNDIFEISSCDYKNIRLEVFNRWGQLVYSNDNYSNQWAGFNRDGKSGNQLPEGVYFWILKGTEPNGKTTVKQGTVNLLKQ